MTEVLSPARIQELYAVFAGQHMWEAWHKEFEAGLAWAASASDASLLTVEGQTRLWKLKSLGKTGPAEAMNIDALAADPVLARRIVALRRNVWDTAPSRRAAALQEAYNQLLGEVSRITQAARPRARLVRILHALLPGDQHCCYNAESNTAVRNLLCGERNLGVVGTAVIARARLREALGTEADLAEHARRSMFCWWLGENVAEINAGKTPAVPAAGAPVQATPATARLVLWPFARQYRWVQPFQGGVDTLRTTLREALDGVDEAGIVAVLEAEIEDLPAHTRHTVLRNTRRLGLLEAQDGRYTTTAAGEALLEADPPDPLIEALIVRVSGFAAMLRHIAQHGPDRSALVAAMSPYCQGKNPDGFTSSLQWWSSQTGLTTQGRALTDLGRAWLDRLPEDLELPTLNVDPPPPELEDEETPPTSTALAYPTFLDLWSTLHAGAGDFVLDRSQVRAIHTAWTFHARKRFVILSGLSGTGKTQILQRTAEAVCDRLGLKASEHIALVPVRPDWRDPTGLLGYFNALHAEPTFQAEPALRLLIRASKNPGLPYFLLLDEMNLARVERYFAPFLSAMETGKPIELHAEARDINGVPSTLPWPANLRIGGTVNMDETTYPFSDKVLDRAFTLELWDVDLPKLFAGRTSEVTALLLKLHDVLKPVRRHFGYRTAGEVIDWVAHARSHDPLANDVELLDQAVFSKVLPRLRGSESQAWRDALGKVREACDHLPRSRDKIDAMLAQLHDAGVSGFWS